jgi:hypothetical protein
MSDSKRSALVACFRVEPRTVLGRESKDWTIKTPPVQSFGLLKVLTQRASGTQSALSQGVSVQFPGLAKSACGIWAGANE